MNAMRYTLAWLAGVTLLAGCSMGPEPPPPTVTAAAAGPASTVTLPAAITSLTALGGSASVAAGLADGRVAVWAASGSPQLLKPHAVRVLAVGAANGGAEVWSLAEDGTLARTTITGGAAPAIRTLDLGAAPTRAAAFSPDGALLATGGEFGDVRVFDTATGVLRQTLRGHRTELQAIAVKKGAPIVATASAESDLKVWDTNAGRELSSIESDLSLFAVAFSPTDGTLASGGVDRRVTFRDGSTLAAGPAIQLEAPEMVGALAWSPDGRLLAIADIDDGTLATGKLRIVSAATRAVVATLDTGGVPPSAVAFVGEGTMVVAVVGAEWRGRQHLSAWQVPPQK